MARRAFLLGRNTGQLCHCAAYDEQGELKRSDLWLMWDCLDRELQFDRIEIAPCGASHSEILGQLEDVADSCLPEDTFVFYFAGHSWASDGLQLIIANAIEKRRNWMPANQIVGIVKACSALSKLMILDSCEAGNVADGMLPDPRSNIRIFTATDGIYRAQERKKLGAGVFTFHLWKALTDETLRHSGRNGVLDEDGNLCLERVHRWLRSAVDDYVKPDEPKIPEPQLYGSAGKAIFFATALEPHRRPGFSSGQIREFLALLHESELSESSVDVEAIYEDVLAKSRLRGGDYLEVAPKLSEEGLDKAIDFLAHTGKRCGEEITVPVPLLELAARLADSVANSKEITEWYADAANKLRDKEFTQAHIDALGYTRNIPGSELRAGYLLVAFEPLDRNSSTAYTAEAWLMDAQGNGAKVAKQPELTPNRFAGFLEEALGQRRVQDYLRGADTRLCLELMLPLALLDIDHDKWTPKDWTARLSTQYPLVLRAIERNPAISIARYTAGWGASGHCFKPCRSAPNAAARTIWLETPPYDGFLDLIEEQGLCLFGLCYRPQEEDFRDMLEDGVAMALWSAKPLPEVLYKELRHRVDENPLHTLPDALRKIRYRQWRHADSVPDAESSFAGGVRLLWDDPARVPRRYGKVHKSGHVAKLRNPMRST